MSNDAWYAQELSDAIAETMAKYDPDEPRDRDGRWTAVGGGGITEDEKNALRTYTTPTKNTVKEYDEINKGLIAGKVPDEYKDTVKHIDSAIDKSTLANDMKLQRVAKSNGKFNGDLFKNNVGKEMTLSGYTSTSTEKLKGKAKIKGDLFFEISAPKGAHAADLSGVDEKGKGLYSKYANKEHEILLPRGSKFKIESVKQTPGAPYYDPQHGVKQGWDTHVKLTLLQGK